MAQIVNLQFSDYLVNVRTLFLLDNVWLQVLIAYAEILIWISIFKSWFI